MYFINYYKKKICIIICCRIFTSLMLLSSNMYGQQYSKESIDSLENLLGASSMSDNELFRIYKDLTDAYIFTDTEKSLKYAWIGVNMAGERNNPYQIAEFYYYLGGVYYYSSKQDSALYYFDQSLEMLKHMKKNDEKGMDSLQIELYFSIGIINNNQGKYNLALDNYINALALAEKIKKTDKTVLIYGYLANTYYSISNFQQAETYYLKAESLSRELNDSIRLAEAWQGLCSINIKKEDYATALKYAEESLKILTSLPNVPATKMMRANQYLTDIWLYIPDYGKAMQYARKTVEYARQTNIPSFLSTALYMISHCYLKQGKYRESEETAFEALATDTSILYTNSILYGNIALANMWMGKPAKSEEYFRKTTNAIRAYSNQNFQSSLTEMEVKYETEKKEMQIVAFKEEKRLMTGLSIATGVVLLLVLAVFIFLWRWSIQKKRIAEQQKQLAEQQVIQLEKEKQLVATQAVFDGEVRERTRLARDLHDGLGGKLTCMKINLQELQQIARFDDKKEIQLNAIMEILDDSVREMRRVSHNLMPETLSRSGLKQAIGDFCRSMSSLIVFNWYGDESRLDMKLEAMIYRSIHELVNNALKYADASKIMVQIIREADSISFTVQDDGCGFDTAVEAEGMGLKSIRARVASLGGMILIDSKAGEGTEVNVELVVSG